MTFAALLFITTNAQCNGTQPHFSSCQMQGNGASKNRIDGSNCLEPYICDTVTKRCVGQDESVCGKGVSCPVGMKCFKEYGGSGQEVILYTANEDGTCHPSIGDSVESNALNQLMCKAYNFITGSTGRILAAFLILKMGAEMLGGQIEPKKVLLMVLGMAIWFGAPSLVALFVGRGISCNELY